MRTPVLLLFLSAVPAVQTWAAGPTPTELRAAIQQSACEHPKPARVIYRGSTDGLADCLDDAGAGLIEELRITSSGGAAWDAMRLMQRYAGRIDLLVVETLCASSCANYVIPAANRLRVEPDSVVLLHGSPNLRDLDPQKPGVIEQLKASLSAVRPEASATDVEKEAEAAWDRMRQETITMQPVQQSWARTTLRCDDWLDPHRHRGEPLPPGTQWLLVTPEMARRCFKSTRITDFWPPAQDYPAELGFFRASR